MLARVIAVVVLTAFGVSVGLVAEAVAWGERRLRTTVFQKEKERALSVSTPQISVDTISDTTCAPVETVSIP